VPSDTVPTDFGSRLAQVFAVSGRLCVGVDPHPQLLTEWGLPDTAAGVLEFGSRVVDAVVGRAGILKPQVAFFERHGAAGYSALEGVLASARDAGLLVIADAKRGDVGTSVDAYGEAWLTPGAPLEADALTAVAYQGLGSLGGVLARAAGSGKGVFVLAATSNPEGVATQQALRADGRTVAAGVVAEVRERNGAVPIAGALGPIGVVLGATVRLSDYGIEPEHLAGVPILAPGFGAQGAEISDLGRLFGVASSHTVVTVSRSVLGAGPDGLADAIRRASEEVAA
jgi:orotidine-5'-phosphate decarboxylase